MGHVEVALTLMVCHSTNMCIGGSLLINIYPLFFSSLIRMVRLTSCYKCSLSLALAPEPISIALSFLLAALLLAGTAFSFF